MDVIKPWEHLDELGVTPVSVGGVQFDALLDITEKFDANVPMMYTDMGYETTDDIIPNLMKLDMRLFVTPTPVTWANLPSHVGRNPKEVVDGLKKLLNLRKPVFVSTVKKNYSNMMIQSLKVNKTAEIGYALEVDISLIQLTLAPYEAYTLPDDYEIAASTHVGELLEVGSYDGYIGLDGGVGR